MAILAEYANASKANTYRPCPNCGGDMDCSTRQCCKENRFGRRSKNAVKKKKFEPMVQLGGDTKYVILPPKREPLPERKPTPPTLLQSFNNLAGNTGEKV
jgi:hypothetical protein